MKNKKETNSLSDVLEKMMLIFSPKYGLANYLTTEEMEHLRIKKKNYGTLVIANVIPMYRTSVESASREYPSGCGAALTKEKSRVKALGEFIERFSATNINNDHIIQLCYNTYENQCKLGDCLNLCDLIDFEDSVYSMEESEIRRYCYDNIVSWVRGTVVASGKDIWIPAQKVFLGIPLQNGELKHLQWISTGLACGSSYRNAVVSGIYEVIERDSFMLTWLLHLSGKRIVVDKINDYQLAKLYKHIMTHIVGDDSLYIYDISRTEGIYTILTFIRNDNFNSYGLITSAASDIDPEHALLKSLEELCLTQEFGYSKLYESEQSMAAIQRMQKTDVRTLQAHLFYYGTGKNSHEFDFICDSSSSVHLSDMHSYVLSSDENDVLAYIIDLFNNLGTPIYSVDVTRREISECGLSVVKAIIPGYNDLDCSHSMRLLENKRLLQFQQKYNCPINDAPHPFP